MPSRKNYEELAEEPQSSEPRHILVHMPDKSAKLSHLENLDEFFRRVYEYHQRGGFSCMVAEEILEVFQFSFVVTIFTVLSSCVDYAVLFRDKFPLGFNRTQSLTPYKTTIADVWVKNCGAHLSFWVVIVLIIAIVFGIVRAVRAVFQSLRYYEIRTFYHEILKYPTTELTNLTWYQIQQRLCEVQVEHQLCVHKRHLTELDVYQRILRYENYLVAMFNKEYFPPKLYLKPLDDELVFFTAGFKFNLEMLFFWGPHAPWENYWHIDPGLKRLENLPHIIDRLERVTLYLGLINLALSPLILIWQVLNTICQYTDLIKRDPAVLGARRWSLYGQFYLRHFNELDHELKNRLSRAYRPAIMYMDLFVSPMTVVVAKNVIFFAGGALAILLGLTIIDEDTLQVQNLLLYMTVLGVVVAGARAMIPDENQIFCPELLLNQILAHIHYMPDSWRHYAHTLRVRQQFCQLFQYRVVWILLELLSPIVTPFVMIFWLRPRIGKLLEFVHQFTIEVPGLGDVCSFSQLDVGKHGSEKWKPKPDSGKKAKDGPLVEPFAPLDNDVASPPQQTGATAGPAEMGKTEMSLLHFAITNPAWRPNARANDFLNDLRGQAVLDGEQIQRAQAAVFDNPLLTSLTSIGCFYNAPGPWAGLAPLGSNNGRSVFGAGAMNGFGPSDPNTATRGDLGVSVLANESPDGSPVRYRGRGVKSSDAPLQVQDPCSGFHGAGGMPTSAGSNLVLGSLQASGILPSGPSVCAGGSIVGTDMDNFGAIREMTMSVLYLHEVHRKQLKQRNYGAISGTTNPMYSPGFGRLGGATSSILRETENDDRQNTFGDQVPLVRLREDSSGEQEFLRDEYGVQSTNQLSPLSHLGGSEAEQQRRRQAASVRFQPDAPVHMLNQQSEDEDEDDTPPLSFNLG